jgi:ectoine hydroxylase-related dioxygenase (phytanoyl-CoA dioxygenase family)
LDEFLFDLNGFLVLEDAVDEPLLRALDAEFDAFPRDLERGGWYRGGQRRDYTPETGFELHQAVAAGEPFEELVDHPSWIGHVRHFAGEEESYVHGITIDETIASIRSSGGHHPVHSGGHRSAVRTQYRVEHGVFRCGLVNVILALTDIGDGDGATMVVPGSHKSNFAHPEAGSYEDGDRMDALAGAVPVHLRRGDALLFVDALMHGGSTRTSAGERRVLIYRYGPIWGASRFGYVYDQDWIDRLPDERRAILQPVPPVRRGDTRVPFD